MTETQAPRVHATNFDYRSSRDVEALTLFFKDYLLEEHERLRHFPSGIPLASWLNTILLHVDDEPVGFCSADLTRYAIELIYVAPEHRRLGIARWILTDLRDACPERMRIKAPLSPACRKLAEQLAIPISSPTPDEEARGERAIKDLHETIRQRCRHRRVGSDLRPCHRCYQALLRRAAVAMVTEPSVAMRNAARLLGGAVA
ncbi:hypothetical protein DF19_41860 [Streptomyces olindensis]|nr:hypothetical protein DF19_41860 [Streptomyces olindensis]